MIRLALPNSPYIVPETGLPVEGRMTVYVHDTDTPATLYTLEGENYVQALNPQPLHAGLTDATVFTALGVFDVVVEMDAGGGNWEQVGDYETGMDFDIASYSRNTVDTVEDLRDVNPELGAVTVRWYAEEGDCCPRTYVWDAESENTEDGGYVIGSDVSDSGKWILVWDGDTLPCGVYGVKPGTEANISLLLAYPAVVGSFQMATAPRVRFTRGTYTTNNTWSTSKEILFDPGAKFTNGTYICPKAQVVGNNDSYVADFEFTAADAVAHSSWFRTVNAFWLCGAKRIVIDGTNYFGNSVMTAQATVEEATIEGTKRMAVTYSDGGYVRLVRCAVNATGIFSPNADFVIINGMGWNDGMWNTRTASNFDFGRVSSGNHVEFLSTGNNDQGLSQFSNTAVYVKMREAQLVAIPTSSKVLDLQGRSVDSFSSFSFTAIVNAHVKGNVTLAGTISGFRMSDVVVDGQVDGGTDPIVERVKAKWVTEWTGSFTAYDSEISGPAVTGAHDITVVGGYWRKSIDNATDNVTDTGSVVFRDCVLDRVGGVIRTKNLDIVRCGVYGQTVEVYPYYDNDGSRFLFKGSIDFSEIRGATPVSYKIFHGQGDGCKDCVLAYSWSGNSFSGNDKGLTFEFWADSSTLAYVLARTGHSVVYSGNSGKCPLEAWHGSKENAQWTVCAFYPADGDIDSPHTGFYRVDVDVRACPPFNGTMSDAGTYGAWMGPSYPLRGNSTTLGFKAATNPTPSYLGYGDAFDSVIVRYGGAGESVVVFV